MTTLAFADTIGFRIATWFKRLNADLKRQQMINATIKELSKLSDKELRDIGIGRGDIYSIAMEAYFDNRKEMF